MLTPRPTNLHQFNSQGQFAYDIYLGDATPKRQADIEYYTVADPIYVSRKHGWNAQACNASYPYLCQVPGAAFPCYPPPSPAPPPPAPPPPPMPPTPPSGGCRACPPVQPQPAFRMSSPR